MFVAIPNEVEAQVKYAKEYEEQGDKAMQEENYGQALQYYTLGRKFLKQNLTLMYKCGEACLMLKDYDKAEYWYQKVLIENDTVNINQIYPYLYLHLAQSSICNGNIIQAQSFLNTCLLDCNDINIRKACKNELAKIDWIIDNDKERDFRIVNLGDNINNETSQLNTFILRDSLLLYTTPEYKTKKTKKGTYYSDIYNRIYSSYIDDHYYTPGKVFQWGNINKKKTNVADFFFDTITNTAYFTYSITKKNKKIPNIYYSVLKDNEWSKPKAFERLKDEEHSYSHPIIARQGTECLMYFASNRDGGQGENDIWYLDMNDEKAQPINLGPTINTAGNEITPFYYAKDKSLYFSSDTHFGFGGFDIFVSEGWKTRWHGVENLMKPINSSANDLYPFIVESDGEGYFTSNRPKENSGENKTCCNDIYRFNAKLPMISTMEQIQQRDKKVFNPMNDLPVALYFHNDSPDAGSEKPTTSMSYEECYKLYISLTNQYKANRSKGLDDSTAAASLQEIDSFMNNKLKQGFDKLTLALDYILEKLSQGKNITVQIRGFASSLYETDYNFNLAERRIVSVENYMRTYKDGVLKQYMDELAQDGKHRLEIEHLSIGKLESTSPNPTSLEEKRQSVYLQQSMEERRIEIKVVQIRN